MKNRLLFVVVLVFAVGSLVLLPSACAKKEQKAAQEKVAEEAEPAAKEVEETVYTRSDPGAWGGKEDSHVPLISYEKTETGLRVTITVNHEMNPDTPHYIMAIMLKDGEDNLLGEKEFQATDKKAEAIFEITTIPSKLKAYERCNIHGLWMDEVDVTVD